VRETDVLVLSRRELHYEDSAAEQDVIYVVTCRPYVVANSSLTLDAGHIAYHDRAQFRDKNSSTGKVLTTRSHLVVALQLTTNSSFMLGSANLRYCYCYCYYYHTRLTAFFLGQPG